MSRTFRRTFESAACDLTLKKLEHGHDIRRIVENVSYHHRYRTFLDALIRQAFHTLYTYKTYLNEIMRSGT